MDSVGNQLFSHALPMIPLYIYYSMFDFQRIGDLAWAAGDRQAQGFVGASQDAPHCGEGLQYWDTRIFCLAQCRTA